MQVYLLSFLAVGAVRALENSKYETRWTARPVRDALDGASDARARTEATRGLSGTHAKFGLTLS